MATNKIASYQRLVEDINVKLNSAARVNTNGRDIEKNRCRCTITT